MKAKQKVQIVHRIQLTGAATGKLATLGLGAFFFDMRIPVIPKCPTALKRRSDGVRGAGWCVRANFLPWMHCICRQSSGQAMPRAHCSLTVDARHAPLHPLPCTPTELQQQQQQQAVILAFAWPWSGAGAGLGLGQAAHMLINNFD